MEYNKWLIDRIIAIKPGSKDSGRLFLIKINNIFLITNPTHTGAYQ